MTLLETVYIHLKHHQLTHSAEHFSTEYLNKSRSWYAVQTHMQRDFSLSAAIECLRRIRTVRISTAPKCEEQETALFIAEYLLKKYLSIQFN